MGGRGTSEAEDYKRLTLVGRKLAEESFRQIQSLDQEVTKIVLLGPRHLASQFGEIRAQEIPQDDGFFCRKDQLRRKASDKQGCVTMNVS
jgi:hypothetical protein